MHEHMHLEGNAEVPALGEGGNRAGDRWVHTPLKNAPMRCPPSPLEAAWTCNASLQAHHSNSISWIKISMRAEQWWE